MQKLCTLLLIPAFSWCALAQTPPPAHKFRLQLQTLDDSLGEAKIVISRDQATALTWLTDGSDVKVWDFQAGRQVRVIDSMGCAGGYIAEVQFTPDGQHMTGFKDDHLHDPKRCTWDLRTGVLEGSVNVTPPSRNHSFTAASGSRVSTQMLGPVNFEFTRLTVSADSGTLLQQVNTNGCVFSAEAAACSALAGVAETIVVLFGRAGSADRWNIPLHSNGAWFSSDGRQLFLVEEQTTGNIASQPDIFQQSVRYRWNGDIHPDYVERSIVSVYDVAARSKIETLAPIDGDLAHATSPNGDLVAMFGGAELRLWSVSQRRLLRTLTGRALDDNGLPSAQSVRFTSAEFTGDSQALITGHPDGSFQFWDFNLGRTVKTLRSYVNPIDGVTLSPDGKYLAMAAGFVSVWETGTWREVLRIPAHRYAKIAFSPIKPIVAVGDTDRSMLYLWSLEQGTLSGAYNIPGLSISELVFTADGRFIYVLTREGRIAVADLRADDLTPTLRPDFVPSSDPEYTRIFQAAITFGNGQPMFSISQSLDGSRAAVASRGVVNIVELPGGRQIFSIPYQGMAIAKPVISGDGRLALVQDRPKDRNGLEQEMLALWDLGSHTLLDEFRQPNLSTRYTMFSPAGAVITITRGRMVQWNLNTGRIAREVRGDFEFDSVPDWTRKLVYAPHQSGVAVVRMETGETIATLTPIVGGHQQTLEMLANAGAATPNEVNALFGSRPLESVITPILSTAWAVTAADGRFDTNQLDEIKGMQWIADDDPLHALPLELFMREYFTPGLLPRLLRGEQLESLPDLAARNRLQPQVEIAPLKPSLKLPGAVDVSVSVKNVSSAGKSSAARDLKVFRDGQLVGTRTLDPNLAEQMIEISGVRLPRNGSKTEVEFSAYAFNSDLVKSATARQTIPAPSQTTRRGHAWITTIGVNEMQHVNTLALHFAANDAQRLADDIALHLRQTGEWESVTPKVLASTNSNRTAASKRAIETALTSLSHSVQPEDFVLISFSGHGFTGPQGKFYLVPSDVRGPADRVDPETAISTDELSEWVRAIDAAQIVLVIDACQSAASVDSQGFKPGPMGSAGLGQLAYDKRMLVLAASQSDGTALESGKLQHGLMTYSLLVDGLEKGRADWRPPDGRVTLSEWLAYGVRRVPGLAEEVRTGQVRSARTRGVSKTGSQNRLIQLPALFDFRSEGASDPVLVKNAAK